MRSHENTYEALHTADYYCGQKTYSLLTHYLLTTYLLTTYYLLTSYLLLTYY